MHTHHRICIHENYRYINQSFSRNIYGASHGFPVVKSSSNAGAAGDMGLIPDWEDPLEEEKATHSSILVWKIPWTEKPGGLESIESHRVRHN